MERSKLSPEQRNQLCLLKGLGLTDQAVCYGAGIEERILDYWLETGLTELEAGKKNRYVTFLKKYRKAESDFKALLVGKVQEADKNWTAASWLLERCYPEEFGKRTPKELVKPTKEPPPTEELAFGLDRLSEEDLSLLEYISKKMQT